MKMVKALASLATLFILASCSSIVHDSTQNVTITSVPAGATLQIDGRRFITPAVVPLKGKSEYYFTVDAPGYQTASGKVDGNFRVWSTVVGNIFNLTGLVGFAIDFWGSQTAFELQKDNTVTLIPLPATAAAPMQPGAAPTPGYPAPAYPVPSYPYGSTMSVGAPVPPAANAGR